MHVTAITIPAKTIVREHTISTIESASAIDRDLGFIWKEQSKNYFASGKKNRIVKVKTNSLSFRRIYLEVWILKRKWMHIWWNLQSFPLPILISILLLNGILSWWTLSMSSFGVKNQRLVGSPRNLGLVTISPWIRHKDRSCRRSFFIFHINDLPFELSSKARLFADNTIVCNTVKRISIIQEEMKKLANWKKRKNQWTCNSMLKKCKQHFHRKKWSFRSEHPHYKVILIHMMRCDNSVCWN